MNDTAAVANALRAIEGYNTLLKSGKNPLGSGKKSDDQGVKRKALGIKISTYTQWAAAEKAGLEVIPTGIPEIDEASGIGGLPKGKMVELFGMEAGGKSYIAYKTIASCQKLGGNAALLDIENAFTPEWARTIGIDPDSLMYVNSPMSAEAWLQAAYDLCMVGETDLIVLDSTAALVPQAMLDGVVGDADVAVLARALGPGVAKLSMLAPYKGKGGKKTCIIWINQIREKPGILWGNNETTPGGRALKFYSHMRIDVRKGAIEKVKIGEVDEPISQTSFGTFVKNKLAIPFKKFTFKIPFDSNFTNPLVMLAKYAYEKKLFTKYKGEFRYQPEEENGEVLKTGCADSIQLARWLHSQNLAQQVVARISVLELEDGNEIPEFFESIDENTCPPIEVKTSDEPIASEPEVVVTEETKE